MNTGFLGPAVATVLTACGIETCFDKLNYGGDIKRCNSTYRLRYWNEGKKRGDKMNYMVATVLTACGIETQVQLNQDVPSGTLQQYLPLAVLKPVW